MCYILYILLMRPDQPHYQCGNDENLIPMKIACIFYFLYSRILKTFAWAYLIRSAEISEILF